MTNNIHNINNYIKILALYVGFFLMGCTGNSNSNYDNNLYYIEMVDSIFFSEYNSIVVTNYNKKRLWLLSKKIGKKDSLYTIVDLNNKIKEKSIIKVNLIKNDSLKFIKTSMQMRGRRIFYDIDDSTIAWGIDNDTSYSGYGKIMYDVYMSPQIIDLYIVKKKI